jgi:hypothetical protein
MIVATTLRTSDSCVPESLEAAFFVQAPFLQAKAEGIKSWQAAALSVVALSLIYLTFKH